MHSGFLLGGNAQHNIDDRLAFDKQARVNRTLPWLSPRIARLLPHFSHITQLFFLHGLCWSVAFWGRRWRNNKQPGRTKIPIKRSSILENGVFLFKTGSGVPLWKSRGHWICPCWPPRSAGFQCYAISDSRRASCICELTVVLSRLIGCCTGRWPDTTRGPAAPYGWQKSIHCSPLKALSHLQALNMVNTLLSEENSALYQRNWRKNVKVEQAWGSPATVSLTLMYTKPNSILIIF